MSKETYVKVEGYSSLVRETKTGAIINTNKSAYEKAMQPLLEAQKQRDDFRNTQRDK